MLYSIDLDCVTTIIYLCHMHCAYAAFLRVFDSADIGLRPIPSAHAFSAPSAWLRRSPPDIVCVNLCSRTSWSSLVASKRTTSCYTAGSFPLSRSQWQMTSLSLAFSGFLSGSLIVYGCAVGDFSAEQLSPRQKISVTEMGTGQYLRIGSVRAKKYVSDPNKRDVVVYHRSSQHEASN